MDTEELLQEEETDATRSDTQTTSRFQRLRASAGRLFSVSPRYFLIALVVSAVGLFVPSLIPIVSALPGSQFFGLFVGAFALGALTSEPRYLETTVAGAVTAGVTIFTTHMMIAVVGASLTEFAAIGGAIGGLVALLGYYFGRDLRAGVKKDIQ